MSHKTCYRCVNLDDLFPCNFGTERSKAGKLGTMKENLKINFNYQSALDSLSTLIKEMAAFFFFRYHP